MRAIGASHAGRLVTCRVGNREKAVASNSRGRSAHVSRRVEVNEDWLRNRNDYVAHRTLAEPILFDIRRGWRRRHDDLHLAATSRAGGTGHFKIMGRRGHDRTHFGTDSELKTAATIKGRRTQETSGRLRGGCGQGAASAAPPGAGYQSALLSSCARPARKSRSATLPASIAVCSVLNPDS
jgi:hypothetical protein